MRGAAGIVEGLVLSVGGFGTNGGFGTDPATAGGLGGLGAVGGAGTGGFGMGGAGNDGFVPPTAGFTGCEVSLGISPPGIFVGAY